MSTSQAQLNALFDSAGFLLLHGLDSAEGAEFGVDASPVWTVKKGGFEVRENMCCYTAFSLSRIVRPARAINIREDRSSPPLYAYTSSTLKLHA